MSKQHLITQFAVFTCQKAQKDRVWQEEEKTNETVYNAEMSFTALK